MNKQCSHHGETSHLICWSNPLFGFHMMGTLTNNINGWRLNLSYLSKKYAAMFVFLQDFFEVYLTGGFKKEGSISRKNLNFNANSSRVCIIALLLIWYIWTFEISPKRKWNNYKISKMKYLLKTLQYFVYFALIHLCLWDFLLPISYVHYSSFYRFFNLNLFPI